MGEALYQRRLVFVWMKPSYVSDDDAVLGEAEVLACCFTGDEACANGLNVETVVQCFYTRIRPGRQAGAYLVAHRVRYADKTQALPEHSGEMLAHRSTVVAESMMNAKYREF